MLKSTAIRALIDVGSYDDDLARAVAEADLVHEAVVEDLDTKRAMFEKGRSRPAIALSRVRARNVVGLA